MSLNSLIELVAGRDTNDYVFFLDLMGTTSKLYRAKTGELSERADIAYSQTHFIRVLATMAKEFPQIRVEQISDCAFIHSPDLAAITSVACAVFKHMTIDGSKVLIRSIRGGGGSGLTHYRDTNELEEIKNLRYSPVLGVGNVESSTLEKYGPPGMRLFVTEVVGKEIAKLGRFQVRETKLTLGEKTEVCFEVNWLAPDDIVRSFLSEKFNGLTMREHLEIVAERFQKLPEKYFQNIGCSIHELLGWAEV